MEYIKQINCIFIFLTILSCNSKEKQINTKEKLQTIYFSHFSEQDSIFWTGNDGMQFAQVSQGSYYFESLDSTTRFNAPKFDVGTSNTFSVETAITGPDDEDKSFYGLTLGDVDSESDFFELKLNNSGHYLIKTNELLKEGKYDSSLNKKMKKLSIICISLDAKFLINDKEVFKYPIPKFKEFRAGPMTAKGSAIWMDYFKIQKKKE